MSSVARVYARGLNRDFAYYYTHWLPNSPIAVGTVGELVHGCLFRPLSDLVRRGVTFDPHSDVIVDSDPTPMKYVSSAGVTVRTKLSGEVNPSMPNIPEGSAGLKLEFNSEGAFTIEAKESYEHRLSDVPEIERQILDLYRNNRWPRNYVVVYSLVSAPYADIVISQTASSSVELEAQADGTIGNVELGNAELQFSVRFTSGRVLDLRNSINISPICQLLGLKRRFPIFGSRRPRPLVRGLLDIMAAEMEDELSEDDADIDIEEYQLALLDGDH